MLPPMKIYKCGSLVQPKKKVLSQLLVKKDFLAVFSVLTRTTILFGLLLVTSDLLGNFEKEDQARKGDIDAQLYLGFTLSTASSKQHQEALYWMKKAGNQGSITACRYLGYAYKNGLGTFTNLKKAEKWYLKAIAHGDDQSLLHLAQIFEQDGELLRALAAFKLYSERVSVVTAAASLEQLKKKAPNITENNIDEAINSLEKNITSLPTFKYSHPKKPTSRSSTISHPDGSIYRGKVLHDQPHGYGHRTSSNGTSYIGNFKYGFEDGMGTSFSSNGLVTFKGMWKQGKPVK